MPDDHEAQTMVVISAIAILPATGALLWCTLILQRHSLAGVLYLVAARLSALADGITIGQVQYTRSISKVRPAKHSHNSGGMK